MGKPDIDLIVSRRAMISRERTELEKLRAELDSEEAELEVAERVLKRLAEDSGPRVPIRETA